MYFRCVFYETEQKGNECKMRNPKKIIWKQEVL